MEEAVRCRVYEWKEVICRETFLRVYELNAPPVIKDNDYGTPRDTDATHGSIAKHRDQMDGLR